MLLFLSLSLSAQRARAQDVAPTEAEQAAPEDVQRAELDADDEFQYPTEAGLRPLLVADPSPPPHGSLVRLWKGLRLYLSINALTGMPFGGAPGGGGNWAWGLGGSAGFSYDDWPVTLGADFYGSHFGTLLGSDPSTHETLRVRDRVFMFDLFLRLQPAKWRARPYLEGVVGLKRLSHQFVVDALFADDNNSTVSGGQTASTLGAGGGVDLTLSDTGSTRAYLSFGVRWLHGGKVEFDKFVAGGPDDVRTVQGHYATTTTVFLLGLAIDADLWGPDIQAANQ